MRFEGLDFFQVSPILRGKSAQPANQANQEKAPNDWGEGGWTFQAWGELGQHVLGWG